MIWAEFIHGNLLRPPLLLFFPGSPLTFQLLQSTQTLPPGFFMPVRLQVFYTSFSRYYLAGIGPRFPAKSSNNGQLAHCRSLLPNADSTPAFACFVARWYLWTAAFYIMFRIYSFYVQGDYQKPEAYSVPFLSLFLCFLLRYLSPPSTPLILGLRVALLVPRVSQFPL